MVTSLRSASAIALAALSTAALVASIWTARLDPTKPVPWKAVSVAS